MDKNFTPLDLNALYPKNGGKDTSFNTMSNTILLVLATLTVLVIAVVLFIIIQKKIENQSLLQKALPVLSVRPVSHG